MDHGELFSLPNQFAFHWVQDTFARGGGGAEWILELAWYQFRDPFCHGGSPQNAQKAFKCLPITLPAHATTGVQGKLTTGTCGSGTSWKWARKALKCLLNSLGTAPMVSMGRVCGKGIPELTCVIRCKAVQWCLLLSTLPQKPWLLHLNLTTLSKIQFNSLGIWEPDNQLNRSVSQQTGSRCSLVHIHS